MTSGTALIVGAGIGGLSAAIALRRAGWQVRVFEQASTPRELGFGVGLAPNAIAALHELGVADVVVARAALVAQGRRTARVMATTNPVACYLRELVIRAVPVTAIARTYARINRRSGTDLRYQ